MKITIKVAHLAALMLFADKPGDTLTAPITIHVDDCAAIVKAAKVAVLKYVTLECDGEWWTSGLRVIFKPLDLPYPLWRRIIPVNLSGEGSQFNASNLMLFKRASARLGVERPPRVMHNGKDGALVMIQGEPDFIGVVMPLRFTDVGWPTDLAGFTDQATPPAPTCASAAPPV